MRKRRIVPRETGSWDAAEGWLDLEPLATVEVTSEDPAYPVEGALLAGGAGGWRAEEPGPQTIRVLLDEPRTLRRIRVEFEEAAAARTQEFTLGWSGDGGETFREIVRQQWNFSPEGAAREVEDYAVELAGVTALELRITPDIGGGSAVASLARLRVA